MIEIAFSHGIVSLLQSLITQLNALPAAPRAPEGCFYFLLSAEGMLPYPDGLLVATPYKEGTASEASRSMCTLEATAGFWGGSRVSGVRSRANGKYSGNMDLKGFDALTKINTA